MKKKQKKETQPLLKAFDFIRGATIRYTVGSCAFCFRKTRLVRVQLYDKQVPGTNSYRQEIKF